MTARALPLSVLAGTAVLAAALGGVFAARGTGPEALRGALLGALLGAGGAALEAVLVHRALRLRRRGALAVVLGGFGFRLAVLVGASFALHGTGLADAASFALAFLGAFLAGLPVLAAVTRGGNPAGAGGTAG